MSHTHRPGAGARPFPLPPTPIHVPDDVLADLRRRLELTRWPEDAGNHDRYYGVDRGYPQELVDYWRTGYEWRRGRGRDQRLRALPCPVGPPSHDRQPAVEVPTGITFVGYENPRGVSTDRRVEHFHNSDRAGWYNLVNLTAHDAAATSSPGSSPIGGSTISPDIPGVVGSFVTNRP